MNQTPPPLAPNGTTPPRPPTSGLAIGALVCGIIAVVFSMLFFVAPVPAIIALVLGTIHLLSKRVSSGKALSIAGLACAVIALAISTTVGIWSVKKAKDFVADPLSLEIAPDVAIGDALPGLDAGEAATIARNLNEPIEAPSLENADIGSLLDAITNPGSADFVSAMSNATSLLEGMSNDDTLKGELERLGLQSILGNLQGLGEQLEELNELLEE